MLFHLPLKRSLSPLRKQLTNLAFPIFIETLLIMMLGAVDTVMLSQYSDNTVAAVGLVNQLLVLTFLIFEVTTQGTSIYCAQYKGAKQWRNFVQTAGTSLCFNALLGILLSVFLFTNGQMVLGLMNLRPELMGDGLNYMHIVGGFAFTQAISFTFSAILRAADKAYYPMIVTAGINVLNIIGNYLLIFGNETLGIPAMGVVGAALSTSISRTVAMVIMGYFVVTKVLLKGDLRIHFSHYTFRPFPFDKLKNVLKLGFPAAGEQISYSSSQVVITYFINMLGNEALAARTYCSNIIMFSYLFAWAVGIGGSISIGHLLGQMKKKAAFTMGNYCLRMMVIITFSIAIVMAICGPWILRLLTENPRIIYMGVIILWIDVILEIGRPINIFAVNALRTTGDATYPFMVGVIVQWSVSVALSYLFGIYWGWGLIGMWVTFLLDENIRGIILIKRWRGRKWQRIHLVKA
ncbi:MAG: MATE family efflux transporter [Bacteroidaceae bacterium]